MAEPRKKIHLDTYLGPQPIERFTLLKMCIDHLSYNSKQTKVHERFLLLIWQIKPMTKEK